jgi:Arc/MetJ family transcription regulator
MPEEELIRRDTVVVRRLRLEPGEAMRWHTDPCHRVTVVLAGERLAIEARDGSELARFEVTPGQVDWDEPRRASIAGSMSARCRTKRSRSSSLTGPTPCHSHPRTEYAWSLYDVCMRRRTTIEIDERLLDRARAALGVTTMRATVEEALRRAADQAETESARLAAAQSAFLTRIEALTDLDVLGSDEMWR